MVKARVHVIYRCRKCGHRLGDIHPREDCENFGVKMYFKNQSEYPAGSVFNFNEKGRAPIEIKCEKCNELNGIVI